METLKGYTFSSIPAEGLYKFFDILEYDGPILSHFRDAKGNNYMFYWVDNDHLVNRWLVWRVSDLQLYQYFINESSLKDLMENTNKEFIYSVEIDSNLNHQNIVAMNLTDIPEAYLLEEGLFFRRDLPKVYDALFEGIASEDFYYQKLRETSLYFNIKPTNRRFRTIVSASEGAFFLKNISKSLASFARVNFLRHNRELINDLAQFEKTLKQVVKATEPQLSYAGISSFEVGVSIDVSQNIENGKYKRWQDMLIKEFESEVVNIDYSNEDEIQKIIDSYGEKDRKAIFGPYLDIIENEDIIVEVTNYNRDFRRSFKTINKDLTKTIVPKNKRTDKKETDSTFVYAIVEIPENQNIETIDKRQLIAGLVSEHKSKDLSERIKEHDNSKYHITFNNEFEYNIRIDGKYKVVYCNDPFISVSDLSREVAVRKFFDEMIGQYEEAIRTNENVDYWTKLIQQIIYKS